MAGNKTRDGIRIGKILGLAGEMGIGIRPGRKHSKVLEYPGLRPCPVETSSDARTMIAPWMSKVNHISPWENYQRIKQY